MNNAIKMACEDTKKIFEMNTEELVELVNELSEIDSVEVNETIDMLRFQNDITAYQYACLEGHYFPY